MKFSVFLSILFLPSIFLGMDKKYNYLTSGAFKGRLQDAAEWIKDCPTIIEIGGGENPISKYVQSAEVKIFVIDPVLKSKRRKEEGNVTYIPKCIEDWDVPTIDGKYAVVLMGLALVIHDQKNGWHKIYDLINGSAKTVLEYSVEYKKGRQEAKDIMNSVNKKVTHEKEYDLTDACHLKGKEFYPLRKMIYLS